MTISEINQKVAALKAKRTPLVNEKTTIIRHIAGINADCAITMPGRLYQDKQRERNALVSALQGIEQQIGDLNSEISTLASTPPSDAKNKTVDVAGQRPIVQELVELRDRYEQFAADATRVSSTRIMAAEFTGKLTQIIRHAVAHAK